MEVTPKTFRKATTALVDIAKKYHFTSYHIAFNIGKYKRSQEFHMKMFVPPRNQGEYFTKFSGKCQGLELAILEDRYNIENFCEPDEVYWIGNVINEKPGYDLAYGKGIHDTVAVIIGQHSKLEDLYSKFAWFCTISGKLREKEYVTFRITPYTKQDASDNNNSSSASDNNNSSSASDNNNSVEVSFRNLRVSGLETFSAWALINKSLFVRLFQMQLDDSLVGTEYKCPKRERTVSVEEQLHKPDECDEGRLEYVLDRQIRPVICAVLRSKKE